MADKKGAIPSIKPAQDEVASYRRSGMSKAPKQSNFNGLLVFVIVLMAIMMGIGGYTLFEVQKKLERSNALLAEGQENVRMLEARLAATGTDVSQTLQDMKEQVSTNFSEIDKLWAVSHRQNKPNIQANVRAIDELKTDLGGKVTTMDASVKQMLSQYQTIVDELTSIRAGVLQENQELITEIALLRGQVQDQSDRQEAVRRNLTTLDKQLKDVNDAIAAIDRHRGQLAQKINELESRPPSAAGPVTVN